MTTLNKNTKKALHFLEARENAKNNGNYSIYSIYAKPSNIKINIAERIQQKYNIVVFHYGNCSTFTASGLDAEGNLIILTKDNTYKILL